MIKLLVFDMDGVLTEEKSSWYYVHKRLGIDNYNNFKRYIDKEIDYNTLFKLDLESWINKYGKIKKDFILNILNEIKIRDNLNYLIDYLNKNNIKSIIVSAGISWLSDIIMEKYHFDYAYANEIFTDINNNVLPCGKINVIPDKKNIVIENFIKKHNINKDNVLSIGDSKTDYSMHLASKYFISFNSDDDYIKNISDYNIKNDITKVIDFLNLY